MNWNWGWGFVCYAGPVSPLMLLLLRIWLCDCTGLGSRPSAHSPIPACAGVKTRLAFSSLSRFTSREPGPQLSNKRQWRLKEASLVLGATESSRHRTILLCVYTGDPALLPVTSEHSQSLWSPRLGTSHPRQALGGWGLNGTFIDDSTPRSLG